ncbi:hypothetical protein [Fervidibacillus albus]|uniref:Uncharacterized protein n=1 Tax=Fervidibacillus albus TaxID=2980026 RepID=A0A9E8LW12_9BACI|nr:hypothetical protein [Fervidibacillus albus]WAA10136.1 hypothetical protein OE104_01975 [Fervidibacillus albus]
MSIIVRKKSSILFPFKYSLIAFVGEKTIRFPVNPDDQIIPVYRLATDDNLWLLLLKNDVKVIEGE